MALMKDQVNQIHICEMRICWIKVIPSKGGTSYVEPELTQLAGWLAKIDSALIGVTIDIFNGKQQET
ncbi:hypothetical protein CR513_19354, partial [Mucuna pruriens]